MDHQVTQDATGTHLDWRHDGVTARMIDWFWSNMEKGFVLWHPTEHEPLTWVVAPQDGDPVGSVHLAPQTWSDGTFQNLYIRFEDPTEVPGPIARARDPRALRHRRGPRVRPREPGRARTPWATASTSGRRPTPASPGARRRSVRASPRSKADGLVWAKHCAEEIGNWGAFLPQLYELYKAVPRGPRNPFADLSVERRGGTLRYRRP